MFSIGLAILTLCGSFALSMLVFHSPMPFILGVLLPYISSGITTLILYIVDHMEFENDKYRGILFLLLTAIAYTMLGYVLMLILPYLSFKICFIVIMLLLFMSFILTEDNEDEG